MTVKEKIMSIVDNPEQRGYDMEIDNWQKLVAIAYYMGRESATKEVNDKYTKLIQEQRKRANECRYNKMANRIIGERDYIYCSDYAGEMTVIFGGDETNL